MNKRSITALIIGIIVLFSTITISILCIRDWSGLTMGAFITILWSEIVFFAGLVIVELISVKNKQIIIRSTYYVFLTLYLIINFVIFNNMLNNKKC